VVITGPDLAREEYAFDVSSALRHTELAGGLRRSLAIASGRGGARGARTRT
jgi:hypothetical protein